MASLAELRMLLDAEDTAAASALEYLEGFETTEWVTVYRDSDNDTGDPTERHLWLAYLARPDAVTAGLRRFSFDFNVGDGRSGFAQCATSEGEWETIYETVDGRDVVPLVFVRRFDGLFPEEVELAEDFRMFWNLHHEAASGRYVTTDEVGDTVEVAHVQDGALRVSKKFVRRYQAARGLSLALQSVVDRRAGEEMRHLVGTAIEVQNDGFALAYVVRPSLNADRPVMSRLLGKRFIDAPPIERCGVWPYEPPEQFEDFIIGLDADGEEVTYSCDPDHLANNFERNAEAPHYLTPVFFTRAVLDRYYGDADRFEVDDGYLRSSPFWGLRMDNALGDHVAVFLGDLGTDLPHREQRYWRTFNVAPSGDLSETAVRRSFLGEFYDSERVEYRLRVAYERANQMWQDRFDFPLYKALHVGDSHVLKSLHVPTNQSFGQFDDQLTRLAKLTVDSLNEAGLDARLGDKKKDEKGLSKLERFLSQEAVDASDLCRVLRQVQGARSKSSAHRKGDTFDVALLLDGAPDLPTLFERLLNDIVSGLEALCDAL